MCFIATPQRRSDRYCLETGFLGAKTACVRVLVALTETGRSQVDLRARLIELDGVGSYLGDADEASPALARLTRTFGAGIVALDQPDATPAPGKVGVYVNGTTRVVAVTLRDGSRRFVRWDGEVYSTNVAAFTGSAEDVIRLP